MSTFSPIVLNLKTHNPAGYIQPGNIAQWKHLPEDTPATGASTLSLDIRAGKGSAAGTTKVQWKLKIPTVATEANSCVCPGQVLDFTIMDLVLTLPDGGLPSVRDDLLSRIQSLVETNEFKASVQLVQGVW